MPRSLVQKVIPFKRDLEATLNLTGSGPPEGWSVSGNRIYKALGWSLSSLGNYTDFTNLFRNYRIKAARVRLYFSNTMSGVEDSNSHANSQILVRMAPNHRGQSDALDDAYWATIQAKKYKLGLNGGKPLDIYMPLVQRNELTSSTGTGTSTMSPKFISTDTSNVVHWGLNMSFERADGQAFSSGFANTQRVRMITTLYFQMKGVE